MQHKTWRHCGRSCKSFVKIGSWWRKTNRTIRWLVPSTVPLRRAGVEQLYQVKRMLGRIGNQRVVLDLFSNLKFVRFSGYLWWTSGSRDKPVWPNFGKLSSGVCVCALSWCCGGVVCPFKTRVDSNRALCVRSKLLPCVPAPRAHVGHALVLLAHTEALWTYTRARFEWTHGGFEWTHHTATAPRQRTHTTHTPEDSLPKFGHIGLWRDPEVHHK